jgi:NAD+ diphosphatase
MKKGVDGLFKLLNISYKKKMDLTIDVEDYKLNVRATVIIEHNGKILVHRNVNSNHYALMGGRVKIGEDSETTVKREVMEETGLKVKNIRYYKSQPWGLSGSILSGFYCELDGDDTITLQEEELSLGKWVKAEELSLEDDGISLTREMILKFREDCLTE